MQIIAPNPVDQEHLEQVIADMQAMGAPVIRAVWIELYGMWAAIEGSHRLAAAQELGLAPEIIPVPTDTDDDLDVRIDSLADDYQDNDTVGDFIDGVGYRHHSPIYTF